MKKLRCPLCSEEATDVEIAFGACPSDYCKKDRLNRWLLAKRYGKRLTVKADTPPKLRIIK